MGFRRWLIRGIVTSMALGVYFYFGLDKMVQGFLGGGLWGYVGGVFVTWLIGTVFGAWLTRNMEEPS